MSLDAALSRLQAAIRVKDTRTCTLVLTELHATDPALGQAVLWFLIERGLTRAANGGTL